MPEITVEILEKALAQRLRDRMGAEEIHELAKYVMDFFGFEDAIIDNILEPHDRDVFYMLEEERILSTERDEVAVQRGKIWRIHYWILNKREILRLAEEHETGPVGEKKAPCSIYEEIDDEVWKKRQG